jgi:hypothetical protein
MKQIIFLACILYGCDSNQKNSDSQTIQETRLQKPLIDTSVQGPFTYLRDTNGIIVDSITESERKYQEEKQNEREIQEQEQKQKQKAYMKEMEKRGCIFKYQFAYTQKNERVIKVSYSNNSEIHIIAVQTFSDNYRNNYINNYQVNIQPKTKGTFFLDQESFDSKKYITETDHVIISVIDVNNNKISFLDDRCMFANQ